MVERLSSPSNAHGERASAWALHSALDALGARTVWCASATPDGHERSAALRAELERAAGGELAPRAVRSLRGTDGFAAIADDDIVVLHDPVVAGFAADVRAREAHAVVDVEHAHAGDSAIHAFLGTWHEDGPRGLRVRRIAAVIPAAGVVAVRELVIDQPATRSLAWTSVLADVVRTDRDETVGGTFHPRPAVAAR